MSLAEINERAHRNQFTSSWTPEAKARLRALWADPAMSVRQIAALLYAEFGVLWSQQSISFRAHSLGMPRRYGGAGHSLWTDAMTERLRCLWADEYSASNIAVIMGEEFGTKFSRSAVIGKAHRLALATRKVHPAHTDPIKLADRLAQRRNYLRGWRASNRDRVNAYERGRYGRYRERLMAREFAPAVEDFAIPTPQRKTIFELSSHDCRWPIGDPAGDLFFFCGAVAEDSRPYCPAHCLRAYRETRSY